MCTDEDGDLEAEVVMVEGEKVMVEEKVAEENGEVMVEEENGAAVEEKHGEVMVVEERG